MSNEIEKTEFLKGERFLPQVYDYYAGRAGGEFLKQLRDNAKIIGLRCPECDRVYVPPRATCIHCFKDLKDFVEVSDEGTLVTYTVINSPKEYYPAETPFVYGIIRLDGATTGLVHMLGEADLQELKEGLRVKAVFKEERTASILDINYFKPL